MSKTFDIKLDDTTLNVEVALDEVSRKKGLSKREITDTTAMLFVFPKEGKHQMWMKDTEDDLDILFLNDAGTVIEVITGEKGEKELLGSKDNVKYVLEIPAGYSEKFDVIVGDELDIPEEYQETGEEDTDSMTLLDEDGNPQMELKGGERIFSRKKTKEMIAKALEGKSVNDLEALGKLVAEEIIAQDKRGPEYVEVDEEVVYAQNGTRLNIIPRFKEFGGMDITDVRAVLSKYGYQLEKLKNDDTL